MKHSESGCTMVHSIGECVFQGFCAYLFTVCRFTEAKMNGTLFILFVRKRQGSQSVDSINPSPLHTSQPQNTRVPQKNKVAELLLP